MNFKVRLEELGAGGTMGAPDLAIRAFEKRFGLKLPASYREFLHQCGGASVCVLAPVQEPTPFGQEVGIDQFFGFSGGPMGGGDLRNNTEMALGAPVAIPIAENLSGYWTYLICEGPLAGGVYHHDRESRSAWPDRLFHETFEKLAPSIEEYLELRRCGRLPRKSLELA